MHHDVRSTVIRSALSLLLVLAGCGGGRGGGEEASGSGDTTAAGDTSSTEPGSGSERTTKEQKARLERPSGAPLGEVIPPGDDAYLLLATGRCDELLGKTETWRDGENPVNENAFFLYRAAAHACLQSWDDAERDYQRLGRLDSRFSGDCDSTNCERCMRAVKEWLDGVLAAHRRDPDAEVEYVRGTKGSPCPAPGNGTPDDEQTTTTEEETTTTERSTTTRRGTASTATTLP